MITNMLMLDNQEQKCGLTYINDSGIQFLSAPKFACTPHNITIKQKLL